jgi:hypothetical protein
MCSKSRLLPMEGILFISIVGWDLKTHLCGDAAIKLFCGCLLYVSEPIGEKALVIVNDLNWACRNTQ